MPASKQVNLYQKAFLSVMGPLFLHLGVGNGIPVHKGTVVCVNTLVPQTGNALYGFCPGASHVCDRDVKNNSNRKKAGSILSISKAVLHDAATS